ncbi:hypothetical protein ACWD00_00510 [Streptomyces viridiviolaceus]
MVWNDCLRDRRAAHAAGLPYVKSSELFQEDSFRRVEDRWLLDMRSTFLAFAGPTERIEPAAKA